ncbi:Piso0_004607 [Millerozyma farinosa CBS 7064]|uniref:Piso0_004607 protein n=1 Tax=Pichia sorbitophila (strain ATCC MYA-4447 / BCRC 22081 / CBS 7064 / NBRC 10061 / NRRL Y-12695) TaxID=559304 RepID=G8Y5X7_PICSO|nr:Piso0_004607 [Millerozyma farinosa CBS 7064]CCE85038.1 Piso0_004607 [Millerozyma farinosa CBS 7064]
MSVIYNISNKMAVLEESNNSQKIALGCFVALVSSALQSLGIVLQRKSHLLVPQDGHGIIYSQHNLNKKKRNMWVCGFFLFIITNILGSLIQITTLPLILLSPLQSIGLIFNSVFGCMLLPDEIFTVKLMVGTVVIFIGAFLVAYNGNFEQTPENGGLEFKIDLLIKKITATSFLMWFVGTFVIVGTLLTVNAWLKWRANNLGKISRRRKMKIRRRIKFIRGINYGIVSGTLTAHTFLFAKSLVDLVIDIITAGDHRVWKILREFNFAPLTLTLLMLAIIAFQLISFNLGLSQVSTAVLYPLCFLVFNFISLINDLTFNSLLKDNLITFKQLLLIVVGLVAVLIGVLIISRHSTESDVKRKSIVESYRSDHQYSLHDLIGSPGYGSTESESGILKKQSPLEFEHDNLLSLISYGSKTLDDQV